MSTPIPPCPIPAITLCVVDDHTLVRRGLIALLQQYDGMEVVGEAGDAAEALRLAPTLAPDIVLLDNHLPGVAGIDAVKDLLRLMPRTRVLMLTVSEDAHDLSAALRNGAQGYLLKSIDGDVLADAIRRAARGEPVVSLELMGKLVEAFQAQDGLPPLDPAVQPRMAVSGSSVPSPLLTPREEEVLREIARGASNKEIARTLDIAETTVKIHVQHILRKLELTSRVQAAVYAADRQRQP